MGKRKIYLKILIIFILAFFAGNLSYPKYFNQGVDFLNQKLSWKLAHFWEIPFKLGLDLQGGVHLLYQADLSNISPEDKGDSMEGLRDVIERRVNLFGVKEPVVQVQGERLIIELAGIKDVSEAIKMIGQTPYLEFKEQRSEEETQKILDKQKEMEGLTTEEIQEVEDWQLAFEDPYFKSTQLTGKYLKKSEIGFDQTTSKPLILLQFDEEGEKIFEDLTSRNIGKPVAIYLDYQLQQAPIVQEKISGGKAQITGKFTLDEVKKRVRELNAGALPLPIKLISQQAVGPTLGKISLEQSLKAGALGFLAIILFIILFYRLAGILASIALGVYIALFLLFLKIIPVTLTLAGIGGFILSIGMAVDANILIFARMREELAEKKTFSVSLEEGFKRAWSSIRDGNLTTLIVALFLFSFGTSFIKGFALTLGLGILLSMFSAIFITKTFLKSFEGTRLEKIGWLWR
ncbi:MAG: protein translocase subunit SecD [Candidatus Pacebacteria bacterium]|nr:protein translocase subunit SecD [Candidatus Paceibacterota bacterium]